MTPAEGTTAEGTTAAGGQVPIVDYLVLGDRPHLRVTVCDACGATYFDRRNACASCGGRSFSPAEVATEGELRSFTIVHQAAAGIATPFVAAVIECGGIQVRGNVINTPSDPEHVSLGMKLRLATYSLGERGGVEAIGYGFEPA
jgi:uncharacterized OB-fold protein